MLLLALSGNSDRSTERQTNRYREATLQVMKHSAEHLPGVVSFVGNESDQRTRVQADRFTRANQNLNQKQVLKVFFRKKARKKALCRVSYLVELSTYK